jgi:hypothetical protein
MRVAIYTGAACLAGFGLFTLARSQGELRCHILVCWKSHSLDETSRWQQANDTTAKGPAITMTKEYQEASTAYAKEQNLNPIVRKLFLNRDQC